MNDVMHNFECFEINDAQFESIHAAIAACDACDDDCMIYADDMPLLHKLHNVYYFAAWGVDDDLTDGENDEFIANDIENYEQCLIEYFQSMNNTFRVI